MKLVKVLKLLAFGSFTFNTEKRSMLEMTLMTFFNLMNNSLHGKTTNKLKKPYKYRAEKTTSVNNSLLYGKTMEYFKKS